jgi:hypothetical protein
MLIFRQLPPHFHFDERIPHHAPCVRKRLGELLVREPRKGAGRPQKGKKQAGKQLPAPTTVNLSSHTLSTYRKIADHASKIDDYAEKVAAEIQLLAHRKLGQLGKKRQRRKVRRGNQARDVENVVSKWNRV